MVRRTSVKKKGKKNKKKKKVSKKGTKNKRSKSRVPLPLEVHFRIQQDFSIDMTRDISPGGVFIQTDSPLPKGTAVELVFGNPLEGNDEGKVRAEGTVVWSNAKKKSSNQRRGMGVEFTRIDVKGQNIIDNIINDFLKKVSIV